MNFDNGVITLIVFKTSIRIVSSPIIFVLNYYINCFKLLTVADILIIQSRDPVCFDTTNGALLRKWRSCDVPADNEWTVQHQMIVLEVIVPTHVV